MKEDTSKRGKKIRSTKGGLNKLNGEFFCLKSFLFIFIIHIFFFWLNYLKINYKLSTKNNSIIFLYYYYYLPFFGNTTKKFQIYICYAIIIIIIIKKGLLYFSSSFLLKFYSFSVSINKIILENKTKHKKKQKKTLFIYECNRNTKFKKKASGNA